MRLKSLFAILLALPLFVVGCNNEPESKEQPKETLYDEIMRSGTREVSSFYGLADHDYVLTFSNATGDLSVRVILTGIENEEFAIGTYNVKNKGLVIDKCRVFVGTDTVYDFKGGEGSVVVSGDSQLYVFDIELTNQQYKFHFTYDGEIENIVLPEPALPTTPVEFTAVEVTARHTAPVNGGNHHYNVVLSDNGYWWGNEERPNTTYYILSIYGDLGTFHEYVQVSLPVGTYTLDTYNTYEVGTIDSVKSGYFVTNDDASGYVAKVGFQSATLVVNENSAVLTAVIGGVEHTVTSNEALIAIADPVSIPKRYVDVEAQYAYAYYMGDTYGSGKGDVFKFFFSDLGLDTDGNKKPFGTYYEIELYSPIIDRSKGIAIPVGTYTYQTEYIGVEPWTTSSMMFHTLGEDGVTSTGRVGSADAGSFITFNEDGSVYAEIAQYNGEVRRVSFSNGDITIYNEAFPLEPPYSSLDGDKVCDLSNHKITLKNRGDYYKVGRQNWAVNISPKDYLGDSISFDILTNADAADAFGKFIVSDTLGDYTACIGSVDGKNLVGSWYYNRKSLSRITGYAPAMSGWVEITDNGDDTASVTFEIFDDKENKITGSWSGNLQ